MGGRGGINTIPSIPSALDCVIISPIVSGLPNLFAHLELKDMEKADRIRACYLHTCLKYVQRDTMTNSTLRERFGIDEKNSATASRIIAETIEAGFIRPYDKDAS